MRSLILAATTSLICCAAPVLAAPSAPSSAPAASAASSLYAPRLISAEDASKDVALLRRALETVHPGLYRYTPKAQIDAAFARLEAAASQPITELALHAEIARMLATIHCDHSKAEVSDTLAAFRRTHATHLPLRFRLIEGRMIAQSNDGQPGAPPRGSEIVAINGMPVPQLLLKLSALVSYDGATDHAIAAKFGDDSDLAGDDFNEFYPSLFGFPGSWSIEWKPVGALEPQTATLDPIVFAAWTALVPPGAKYRGDFYNSNSWRMNGKLARLQIDTFVNYRNPVQASAFLGGFFEAMREAGTEHLILDLRNNGGGSEDVPVALGRYLIGAPFVWTKPLRYKAVRYGDLPRYFETWGDPARLYNAPMDAFEQSGDGWYDRKPVMAGTRVTDKDTQLQQQPVGQMRFGGRLTILSGPRIGSATTMAIAQLKEKAGAEVIGEDSGGSAEGPTAGRIFLLKLPASGLKVRIPEAWNRTAISRFDPGLGVSADRLVVPTLADFEDGRDRAIDVARGALPTVDKVAALAGGALAGDWTGTLDYRDFRKDSRATLPTLLRSDGQTLDWTFDDGPGKTVRSSERWSFDASDQVLTIRNAKAGSPPETWRVVEARGSEDGMSVTIVLEGQGSENGRSVLARKILTRQGDRLRLTKMTRVAGEPFLMRQSYELRR